MPQGPWGMRNGPREEGVAAAEVREGWTGSPTGAGAVAGCTRRANGGMPGGGVGDAEEGLVIFNSIIGRRESRVSAG